VPNFAGVSHESKSPAAEAFEVSAAGKSISEEGSVGIAQASIVHDDENWHSASSLFTGKTRLRRLRSNTSKGVRFM